MQGSLVFPGYPERVIEERKSQPQRVRSDKKKWKNTLNFSRSAFVTPKFIQPAANLELKRRKSKLSPNGLLNK